MFDLIPEESESNKEKLKSSFLKVLGSLKEKNPAEYDKPSFRKFLEASILELLDCETRDEVIQFHQDKLEELKFFSKKRSREEQKKAVLEFMKKIKKKRKAQYSREEIATQLRRVEKEIHECLKMLRRCERTQLSGEELEEDTTPYIYHEKYAKKLKKLWQQWCDIKGYQYYTGNSFRKPYKLNKTINAPPEVRRDIDSVITQYFQDGEVPDYPDIVALIEKSVEKCGVNMKKIEVSTLAQSVHQDVINVAKIRRERDREELFDIISTEEHCLPQGGSLPPTELPPDVEKKFQENKAKCASKLEEEFKKWECEEGKISDEKRKEIRENGDPEADEDAEEDEEDDEDEDEIEGDEREDDKSPGKDESMSEEDMEVDDVSPPPSSKSTAKRPDALVDNDTSESVAESPKISTSSESHRAKPLNQDIKSEATTSPHQPKPNVPIVDDDDDDCIILD